MFDTESGYDSPTAWCEIVMFDVWFFPVQFLSLLLLVSGRRTQPMPPPIDTVPHGMHPHILGHPSIKACIPIYWGTPVNGPQYWGMHPHILVSCLGAGLCCSILYVFIFSHNSQRPSHHTSAPHIDLGWFNSTTPITRANAL